MSEKQLIVVVEGTATMGPYWSTILTDYIEKIIRSFCTNDPMGQKGTPELSLVMFHSHGCYSACLVQRSGWTKNADTFMQWLTSLPFIGGGFNDAAIAEGLSEALMMFPVVPSGSQVEAGIDGQKHCILIAANNPYPLPTPVYRPQLTIDQSESIEAQPESCLSDAESVAKSFPLVNVSLSVISPKTFPKLNAIYSAGRRSGRAPDSAVEDTKNPNYLILISEMFTEARTAISHSGIQSIPSNPSPVKPDVIPPTVSTSIPISASSGVPQTGSLINRSTAPALNVPVATVKVEPGAANSMTSAPSFSHISPLSRASPQTAPNMQASSPMSPPQDIVMNGESMLDTKPTVTGSARPMASSAANVNILNNLSQVRQALNSAAMNIGTSMGLPSINQSMHMPNMMTSATQSPAATVTSSPSPLTPPNNALTQYSSPSSNSNLGISPPMNQPNPNAMIPTPGISQPNPGVGANSSTNPLQTAQSKYVRVWEGNLSGQRQGQPVFITRLEGYRNSSSSETLAANWPVTMQIVRLLSQDHMNNKQYVGKADFLVFRALHQHGFLGQLQEKKLCAVIQLPSQTLLLSVSDKASRLIGMLFPGDMVVFRPQPSNQQQQQQQFSQLQHQQQQIAQPYGRTQIVSQPQVPSNLPGGSYMS